MKRSIWISSVSVLVVAVVALAAVHSARGQAGANDAPSGDVWEYLVVAGGTVNLSPSDSATMRKAEGAFSRESFPLERNMDNLGAKGWELVTVTGSPADPIFYFKRRK